MSREQQTKCPQCGSFQRPTPLTAFDAPLVTCGHSWHLVEPTPPATPRGSCAFGQHEWKGTNAEGSCICGELTLSRTPPATPQPGTKACGHRGPCECAHYIDPTRRALSPPPDVERLP